MSRLVRMMALGALALPLAGCFSYIEKPPPPNEVVIPKSADTVVTPSGSP